MWRPSSTVLIESGDERLQLSEKSPALGHREGANDADRCKGAVVLVEPEQERADRAVAGLVHAVARDHAVGRRTCLILNMTRLSG